MSLPCEERGTLARKRLLTALYGDEPLLFHALPVTLKPRSSTGGL
ncbi:MULTISPECIES: hypothetical protein [Pantoea]|nr:MULTISPECIES: hypothetical protein [Pantoea]